MPKFSITPLDKDDLEGILEVYRLCEDFLALGPQPHATIEMVLADLEHSKEEGGRFCGIYLSTAQGMQMVGILDYLPGYFEGLAGQAFISLLMIGAPYRLQGLGSGVVDWLEAEIGTQLEVRFIWTAVQVNNPSGVRFWERQGYRIEAGPLPQPDGTTVFMLRKTLRN